MYSVPMALVDFIPTTLFLLAALSLAKYLKEINKASTCVYMTGAILASCASYIKALYKLISALGKGEVAWMTNQFFTNQALGLFICGVGVLIAVLSKKKVYSFLPTMALVGIMVAGVAMMDISLSILAARAKKKGLIVFFIISLVLSLMMGYLSSKDFTQSYMNWAAEAVVTIGQLMYYLGIKKLTAK